MKSMFEAEVAVEVSPYRYSPIEWCRQNLNDDGWLYSSYAIDNKMTFYFKNSEDATLFKLSNRT